jgi:hypothetical protein
MVSRTTRSTRLTRAATGAGTAPPATIASTMDKVYDAVCRDDAAALVAHGRFLAEKFGAASTGGSLNVDSTPLPDMPDLPAVPPADEDTGSLERLRPPSGRDAS